LIYGSPGRSLALEIAARLGLAAPIVGAARQNLSAREAQLAEHLAKIDKDMRTLEHEQRLVAHEREALTQSEARMREREDALRQREETYRRRLNEELEAEVRQARRQIDDVIAELKTKTTALANDAARQSSVTTGDTGAIRMGARAAVDTIVKTLTEPAAREAGREPGPQPMGTAPAVGDRVMVGGLGLEAVVTAIHDGTAELDVRGKRMRASLRDLRVIASAPATAATVKVHVELQPRETMATDLNVVGCTVDEAISRAERFLDESLLTDHRTVRLIHGYGTGQLKRALAGFLQQHPLVARFDQAPPEQGGGGVTVVELKD
jgi:DNA mismatch repair protein MutS2